MKTLAGQVMDEAGVSETTELVTGPHGPRLRHHYYSKPACEIRKVQAPRIILDVCHSGDPVGEVLHLEQRNGHLWAVASADIDPPEWVLPLFFSAKWSATTRAAAGSTYEDGTDVVIEALSVGPGHREFGIEPVAIFDGAIGRYRGDVGRLDGCNSFERGLLERASETYLRRRESGRGTPIVVAQEGRTSERWRSLEGRFVSSVHPAEIDHLLYGDDEEDDGRPPGRIRRAAVTRGSVLSVS